MDTYLDIPIEDLHDSPFNPRQTFDPVADAEMVEDIKAHGRILQPLMVRPRIGPLFGGQHSQDPHAVAGYEIVFGHRRKRNATTAGLATLPCKVEAMDDATARRMQISENLSRQDVHPLEEAKGFQTLIDDDGETADTIAAKFGKSRSYVYGRLKLLALVPELRTACLAGEVQAEVALLVARLRTPALQAKALGYIKAEYRAKMDDGGQASYRTLRDLLNEKFTLDLNKAMFDIEDEMLLPIAGHCLRCPKRTGNAPEFDDVARADDKAPRIMQMFGRLTHTGPNVCTDPDCFDAKKKAHLAREAAKLTADGKAVLTGTAARNAISAQGDIKGAYIALKDVKAELKKRPRKGADGDATQPQVVLIQDPRTGKTHQAVKREDVKATGVAVPDALPKDHATDWHAQQARANAERARNLADAKAATEANVALVDRTLAAMAGQPRTTEELRWMAVRVLAGTDWRVCKLLAERHGFDEGAEPHEVLSPWPADRLALFAIECVLLQDALVEPYDCYGGKKPLAPELLTRCAALYGATPDAPAAPAGEKTKPKGKSLKQKHDAGHAGGSGGQVDAFGNPEGAFA